MIQSTCHPSLVCVLQLASLPQANENFTTIYSGGRDKLIYKCESRAPDKGVLLCQESAPVLKMLLTPDNSALYVATTNSAIKCWVCLFFLSYFSSFFFIIYSVFIIADDINRLQTEKLPQHAVSIKNNEDCKKDYEIQVQMCLMFLFWKFYLLESCSIVVGRLLQHY